MSSSDQKPVGPRGPCLHVPAGWILAVNGFQYTGHRIKWMLLMQLAAREVFGEDETYTGWPACLCGINDLVDSEKDLDSVLVEQLENESYIENNEGIITLTAKTRKLFGMEVGS